MGKIFFYKVVILCLLSCKGNNEEFNIISKTFEMKLEEKYTPNEFLSNFEDINIKALNKKINSNKKIDDVLIANYLGYTINQIKYSYSFIESKFYYGFKIKLNEEMFLISYLHHYDLHDYDYYFAMFDVNKNCITSKINVNSFNKDCTRNFECIDNKIFIKTIFKRSFENGLEDKKNNVIELNECFIIDKRQFKYCE